LFGEQGYAQRHVRLPESATSCRVLVTIPTATCASNRGWAPADSDGVRSPVDGHLVAGHVCAMIASCTPGKSGFCLADRDVRFLGGALPASGYVGIACELRSSPVASPP
jgi:hypothetical protein